jgi:5-(carboxyamino)imidazole ribonucleotide mutase
MSSRNNSARIAIVMGSKATWATMQLPREIKMPLRFRPVVSKHRAPDQQPLT